MARGGISVELKGYKKLIKQMKALDKKGQIALQKTVSDMKKRMPGPIATQVGKFYSIDKAEINPNSSKAIPGKEAAKIKIKGKKVAELALVYEGRVLTPYGHGFNLKPTQPNPEVKRQRITFKVKKKNQVLKGKHGTVFLAPTKKGGNTYIPFQRIPSTGAIEVIRTVAVPEMIDNPQVNEVIHARIDEIMAKRLQNNFKGLL